MVTLSHPKTTLETGQSLAPDTVMTCAQLSLKPLQTLLSRFDLTIVQVDKDSPIPGSFWGEAEAGLIGNLVYVRSDTPIHSVLHEICRYVCMDMQRRILLHTDAGGGMTKKMGCVIYKFC